MLDEKDLQTLRTIIREEISEAKQEINENVDKKIAEVRQELHEEIVATRQELHEEIVATRQGLHEEIAATRQGLHEEIVTARQETVRAASILMEIDFEKKFKLLAEGHQELKDKLDDCTTSLELMNARVITHEMEIKKLKLDLERLKMAQ